MSAEFCCSICSGNGKEEILRKHTKEGEYLLVRCEDCRQIAISPIPGMDELKQYYNTVFEVPLYQEEKTRRKALTVLNELDLLGIDKGAKILEIGASYGFFMKIANDAGFETYGLEMSEKACEYAKNEFGIEIENSSLGESKFVQNRDSFDAIVLLDVIEHVTDPSEIISQIEGLLNPGGFVVITTPNIDSTEFKFFGRYWEWISPPAHLFYFSTKTLTNLLGHNIEVSRLKTFKGDSGGNIVFHGIYSLLKIIYWSSVGKLFYKSDGKEEALITETSGGAIKKNEFTGVLGLVYLFSLFFTPFTALFDYWRNIRGRGASILMIGKKIN